MCHTVSGLMNMEPSFVPDTNHNFVSDKRLTIG